MEIKTTVINIGGSVFVRIPANMVEYFRLNGHGFPQEAKIEDVDKKAATIKFQYF